MKIEIIDKRRNELLKRDELTFKLSHEGSGTPSRLEVRKSLANILNVDTERVFVQKIKTKTGCMIALGEVNIYDSVNQSEHVEREFIKVRNAPKSEKKE